MKVFAWSSRANANARAVWGELHVTLMVKMRVFSLLVAATAPRRAAGGVDAGIPAFVAASLSSESEVSRSAYVEPREPAARTVSETPPIGPTNARAEDS